MSKLLKIITTQTSDMFTSFALNSGKISYLFNWP